MMREFEVRDACDSGRSACMAERDRKKEGQINEI